LITVTLIWKGYYMRFIFKEDEWQVLWAYVKKESPPDIKKSANSVRNVFTPIFLCIAANVNVLFVPLDL